jgi:hypothetical protein
MQYLLEQDYLHGFLWHRPFSTYKIKKFAKMYAGCKEMHACAMHRHALHRGNTARSRKFYAQDYPCKARFLALHEWSFVLDTILPKFTNTKQKYPGCIC